MATALAVPLLAMTAAFGADRLVEVGDDAALRAALQEAGPGTRIRIAAGSYRPGVYVSGLHGTEQEPVVIEAVDRDRPPVFEGGGEGWHLSDCSHLVLRGITVRGQRSNGLNVDDGGTYETPSHHIVLDGIRVSDVGPRGNHDGIKLSGLDDFEVRNCRIEGWGGQGIDMVGCHRGTIEHCQFHGKPGFSQTVGVQTKGGSHEITVRRCLFLDAGARAVNLGGSTGLAFFRPKGTLYEAKDVVVEGCTFVGSEAPAAFVGARGAVFRYNTIYRPEKWVMRILQETTAPGFASCRDGRFEHNLVIFRRSDVGVFVNVGPNTRPETFTFRDNLWFCEDRPDRSAPQLPVEETGGLYGVDPKLADPANGDFRPQDARAAGLGAWGFGR